MLRFEYYDDWINIYKSDKLIGTIKKGCGSRPQFCILVNHLEEKVENKVNLSLEIEDFEMIKYHMIKFSTKQNVKMNGKVMI